MSAVLRIAIASAVLLVTTGRSEAALRAAEFSSRLDGLMKQVAVYDFDGDAATPIALAELARATHGQPDQRRALAERLAALLDSGAPTGAKDLACRQLSLIGTEENVAAVARLLTDEKLSHMARYALERTAGPAAAEALREALGNTQGKLLVGVINSIGTRRDRGAVPLLAKRLADPDRAVAEAAAHALGKIACPSATAALSDALKSASGPVSPALGEACLACAERLDAKGDRDAAATLYDRLRRAQTNRSVHRAATRGAIVVRESIPLLVEQLKGEDAELFGLALGLVRQMPTAGVGAAAATELARLPAERQVRLVQALADRGDAAAGPAVLALAEKGDPAVRVAAILALQRLGNASTAALLIQVAAGEVPELAQAAVSALCGMPDRKLDALLGRSLNDPNAKIRQVAAEVLGQRHAAGAGELLLRTASDPEKRVRLAAIKALGATLALAELDRLAGLVAKAAGPAERSAAEEAMAAASARIADKDDCAGKLVALLPGADAEGKAALLRTLSQVGGSKALGAVSAAVREPSEEIQDVAVRALSNWTSAEAMQAVAALARESSNGKHKILALRGYIRLIGLSDLAPGAKLALAREAMKLAERDDERKLVLGALGGIGGLEALDWALSFLDEPNMKNEAGSTVVAVGGRLWRSDPGPVRAAMLKVLATVENATVKRRAQDIVNRIEGKVK